MSKMAQAVQKAVDELMGKQPSAVREFGKQFERAVQTPTRQTPIKRTRIKVTKKTRDRKAAAAPVIAAVRVQVFALDTACICGQCKPSEHDEMHEIVPRSKTMRMAPEQRFNIQNCVRLSPRCHHAVTGEVGAGKRLKIALPDPEGAMGRIVLTWKNGRTVTYCRQPIRTWRTELGRDRNLAGHKESEPMSGVPMPT